MTQHRIKLADALRIFRQACVGMQFLWQSAGILHRDLKPENILFSDEGDAKITDFGLASVQSFGLQLLGSDNVRDGSQSSAEPFMGGTLPYMSPEHFGIGELTTASDIYSFGAIMYEMLEGRLLFDCDTVAEFRLAHRYHLAPALSASAGPAGLADIIAKCVAKSPRQRFADFFELENDLVGLIADLRLEVPEPRKPTIEELEGELSANDWGNRGYALAMLSRFDESLRCYQRAHELNPEEVGANVNLGQGLQRAGHGEEALWHFEKEVELHPEKGIFHQVLAKAYWNRGRATEAVAELEIAFDKEPYDFSVMRDLLRLYRNQGRDDDCDRLIGNLIRSLEGNPSFQAHAWVNEGIQLGEQGELSASQAVFDRCVKAFPQSIDGWYNLAVDQVMAAELDGALQSIKKALSMEKDLPQAYFLLGLIMLLANQKKRAAQAWGYLVATNPDHQFGRFAASFLEVVDDLGQELAIFIMTQMNAPNGLYYF